MIDLSRILFTGVEGMVGSYVDFGIRPPERDLDVTKREVVVASVRRYRPTHVVHLAAETDLEVCEQDPAHAYEVNAVGTYHVAAACRAFGIVMVYISTAGIFDGEKSSPYFENDSPNPRNMYGKTKLSGELIVRDLVPGHIIGRACWMFGGGPAKDKKFVAKIIRQLDRPEIHAVNDKFGSPTFGKDLISKIRALIVEGARGTFHLVNEGAASRYDVACAIVKFLGAPVRVVPVSSEYFSLTATRATSEVLGSRIGFLRPWREALREYLAEEWPAHQVAQL